MDLGKNTTIADTLRISNWIISILLIVGFIMGVRSESSRTGGLIAFSVLAVILCYFFIFKSYFISYLYYNDYINGVSPIGLLVCMVIFAIWPFVVLTGHIYYMDRKYLIPGGITFVVLCVLFTVTVHKDIELNMATYMEIALLSFGICYVMLPLFSYTFGHVEYSEQAIVSDYSKKVSARSGTFSKYVLDVNSETLGDYALDVGSKVYENSIENGVVRIEFCKDIFGNRYYYAAEN